MNEYQNIIIIASPYNILVSNFSNNLVQDKKYEDVECLKYSDLPCLENEIYANTVNYLYVINTYLEKVYKKTLEDKKIMCRFFISQKIYSLINKGTYKYWILNGKTESSETKIEEKEIKYWKDFADLYSKVFFNVNFTSLNFITNSNVKYNQRNIEFSQNVINVMYNKIEEINNDNLSKLLKF